MTAVECRVSKTVRDGKPCGALSEAFICEMCCNELESAIAEIPAFMHELSVAAMRQARVYRGTTVRPSDPGWDDPEADIPSRLRSKDGAIALPSTTMPVDFDASHLMALTGNALSGWVRHLAESRGVEAFPDNRKRPEGPAHTDCLHPSCREIAGRTIVSLDDLVAWLLTNIESIRYDDAAPEIYRRLTNLRRRMESAVDIRSPQDYAGRCDAPDVRVEAVPIIGAPCSTLTCEHPSCEAIRTGEAILSPVAGTCGADLYFGGDELECQACGAVYDVADRKAELLSRIPDVIAGTRAIASGLSTLLERITESMIRQMAFRREIFARGGDPRRPLYRVGDVVDVLERRREKRSARDSRQPSQAHRRTA